MDLRRQIAIIRKWLWLLVASTVLAGVAAYAASTVLPKTYEAKATLIVGQSLTAANPDYNQLLVSQRLSTTYAAIVTTRPILEDVIARLQLGVSPDALAEQVRADAALDSTLLTITAGDVDPLRAAAVANALAEQLVAASPDIEGRETEFETFVKAELSAVQTQIEAEQARVEVLLGMPERTADQDADLLALEGRLTTLRSTYAMLLSFVSDASAGVLTVIEPAVAPTEPVWPRPLLNALLAAALGFILATGLAFVVEYLDDSIKDPDAIREAANLSTLGTIAKLNVGRNHGEMYRLAMLLYPRSTAAEAFRTLRSNLEFASVDSPIRTLLVTSAMPGEGKTVTASNLAIVFAQTGRRVLLVDADLRKPGVHAAFNIVNGRGLTTILRGVEDDVATVTHTTEEDNLRVLTAGPLPPNPAELLGSQRMRTVLDRLKADADLLILDSPPVQAVTDSAILSSYVDGTLLVIDARRSRRRAVRLARETLERAGAKVLGAVLNRVPARGAAGYGYYGGGYGVDKSPVQPVATPSKAAEHRGS